MTLTLTLDQGKPGPAIAHQHPPSCKRNPLELPEILALVAEYMDQQTLCHCIRVSRLWHSAFLPFLWSAIRIHGLARLPFEVVEAHANYICELALLDDVDLRYGTDLFCPNLTHLTIDSFLELDNYFRAPAYAFNDFILRHRHTLRSIRFSPPAEVELWAALEHCTLLEHLYISWLKLTDPGEWLSLYDRIWSRLTVLHIAGDWTPTELPKALSLHPSEDLRPPAKIRDLLISRENFVLDEGQRLAQTQVQGWIVQQCRSLVRCDWFTGGYDEEAGPVQQLSERLLFSGQELWPQLESLRLTQEFRASDFAVVVDGLARLTELRMCRTNFNDCCWDAIQRNGRHLASLRTLVFTGCPFVGGRILQAMMASLPNLEQLDAGILNAMDILDDGRPWMCLRLRKLGVAIALDSLESQPMILERLSGLVQLEECRLHGNDDWRPALLLTLESGMDQLRTLKQMRHFQVGPLQRRTEWGREEVKWTREHWPRLKNLLGVKLPSEDIDHSLA